jgi:phospholipid/cholesterol/gamma-HCH transport system permease protein
VGAVTSVLVLTVYFGAMAIIGGGVASAFLGRFSFAALRSGFMSALLPADLPLFLLKGIGLGVFVGWLPCHFGLEVGASPTEVPQRASQAVVLTMLVCVVFNAMATIGFYWIAGPPVR